MASEATTATTAGSSKKLLLISNSTMHGETYLAHCIDTIRAFLGDIKTIVFFPFAGGDWDAYTATAAAKFAEIGVTLTGLHAAEDKVAAVNAAEAFFGGGGNTFRFLKTMYDLKVIDAVRARVAAGVPYIGTSAGSNMACPTIKTTNDMPIVFPPSFDALNAVPWQINPHYLDPDPTSKHNGETRETRINEFHQQAENKEMIVVGLREGSMLQVDGDSVTLSGKYQARIFRAGEAPVEVPVGTTMKLSLEDVPHAS